MRVVEGHDKDQAKAGYADLAELYASFYYSLLNKGLSNEAATAILIAHISASQSRSDS